MGRALLSYLLKDFPEHQYPIFLHTQPSSYRAIKLYSDFGFVLLRDPVVGMRKNDLGESLPILKKVMKPEAFDRLMFQNAPKFFLQAVQSSNINQF